MSSGRSAIFRIACILFFALAATWLTLSGYFKPMLLTLGVISIFLVITMSVRMRIMDDETAPYMTLPQTLSYFVWLFMEIVKANVAVVRAVMSPNMEISPTLTKIPLPQESDIAKVMFANSITLTPGTVSVEMNDDHILVHALLNEMSAPEDFAEMGERSAWAIGEDMGAPGLLADGPVKAKRKTKRSGA
ncbi:Na+/H+ antiporter subunit E [Litorimonas sp. RW-G-Af-16]|uniref:Na+/H+ antiporter subunit E n=1 Tax=Litorimonas sp. RW-G-Af-16 TaxID=3241168 RepID=UPI00390CD6C2